MQTYQEFLLDLDKIRNKKIYAKVTALTFTEAPIQSIEGRVTGGSVNIDGSSAVRRTCSLTLVGNDLDYNDYLWGLNTKFKLEIGIQNTINSDYPDIIWFKQGIFVLTNFNVSRSTSSFTINLSGKDKMCLLNGEIGGALESSVDFGTESYENEDGTWSIAKIAIPDIIRNAVHIYGKEPYHNIIIKDFDGYGKELMEYRYDIPMYLYRSAAKNADQIYDNAMIENDSIDLYIKKDDGTYFPVPMSQLDGYDNNGDVVEALKDKKYLETLVSTLTGEETVEKVYIKTKEGNSDKYTPYYFTKIEYGQTPGYRPTNLTYAGDLISKVGESLTSILDKIKNMLVEYEYFYNLDGQFVFQKKESFLSTMWSVDSEKDSPDYQVGSVDYLFSGSDLVISSNITPNLTNVKNDFSIWGERIGISGGKLPIHLRYAIDIKPTSYTSIPVDYGTYKVDRNGNFILDDNDRKIVDVPGDDYEAIDAYNQKYNVHLEGQSSIEYSIDKYDWREIIYQMSLDYYKYNFLEDFEKRVAEANAGLYPGGRTGYEKYYTDLQGFWRDLYYPELSTDFDEVKTKYDQKNLIVDQLHAFLFGNEVAYDENLVGGLESDITFLNNLITEKKISEAQDAVNFWNTWNGSSWLDGDEEKDSVPNNLYSNFIGPKYDIKDDKNNVISDVYLYLAMIKDLYFRKQGDYNTYKAQLGELEREKDKLEKFKNDNYYSGSKGEKSYWNKNVYENPSMLNFWFDFLEADKTVFGKYSVSNLGSRLKSVQDSNVKSIYYKETPKVIFKKSSENVTPPEDYRLIQVNSIDSMFTISPQGKSAKEKLDELLYQHTCLTESISLTTIPIFHLEPNTRVKISNIDKINGDYIINKITIPLTYNGNMSLSLTKAIDNVIGTGTT